MGLHQTKKLLHSKGNNQQWKGNQLNKRKYLQIIYMIGGKYPKYIKNTYNSIAKQTKKKNLI